MNPLPEGERQLLLLALAVLSIDRPGFHHALSLVADRFGGREMFESFRMSNVDDSARSLFQGIRFPDPPST